MLKKVLIANRGEIAVRVIRACRELGITSVAVFSDVDRAALHVRKADEAYPIGPAAAKESYLNIEKILDVAKRSKAEAIHPGYGFLSENANFARACALGGVKFIGPTAAAMDAMGSKTRARQAMERAGVPYVPGTSRGLESFEQAEQVAARIGYPVMLKAAAGGGGKGMRLVHAPAQLKSSFEEACSEAERSFGDGDIYIEKAIVNPRHIEMQALAEEHGPTDNNYFPSPGKITVLIAPTGPGIRHDTGMYEGWTVPLDYDPLLAKLVGYGENREQVIARLRCALDEYFVGGIKTNISLFRRILR